MKDRNEKYKLSDLRFIWVLRVYLMNYELLYLVKTTHNLKNITFGSRWESILRIWWKNRNNVYLS